MHPPKTYVLYWQQLRPIAECDADDGRVVGRLLLDLVDSKPTDLAHEIRTFANRMAMLRECSCSHIGAMLVHLLTVEVQSGPDENDSASVVLSPSSVTEEQAIAIGRAIASSVKRSDMPATALRRLLQSNSVLRAMKSQYVWFFPMLEVLTDDEAPQGRGSVLQEMKRLSTILTTKSNVAPSDVSHITSDAEEINFSSVVRLGASNQYLVVFALVDDALVAKDCCWLTHLTGVMRHCRRWQMPLPAT
jgi:hypothetical protein